MIGGVSTTCCGAGGVFSMITATATAWAATLTTPANGQRALFLLWDRSALMNISPRIRLPALCAAPDEPSITFPRFRSPPNVRIVASAVMQIIRTVAYGQADIFPPHSGHDYAYSLTTS
jgi:hypothetical protein